MRGGGTGGALENGLKAKLADQGSAESAARASMVLAAITPKMLKHFAVGAFSQQQQSLPDCAGSCDSVTSVDPMPTPSAIGSPATAKTTRITLRTRMTRIRSEAF